MTKERLPEAQAPCLDAEPTPPPASGTSYYREDELARLGLARRGADVRISRHCRIYSPQTIAIGDHVRIDDFCILSGHVTDDFSGEHLAGPTIPEAMSSVHAAPVAFGRFAIVGAGTVVLPGVTVHEGAAIGAMSLSTTPGPATSRRRGTPRSHARPGAPCSSWTPTRS